jgi:predicted RecB family nuclease
MQIQISERLFLDFLQCKLKAFLNFSGRSGVKTEFDEFRDENYAEYCKRARKCLLNCDAAAISHAIASFKEMRKLYISVEAGVKICNDRHSLILDAAELASQSTSLNPVYNPIIFLPHQKISSQHKLLLAFYGSALSHEQKRDPTSGRIIFGNNLSSAKIQLASLIRTVRKIEKEITHMIDRPAAPPLRLTNHCKICGFQEACSATAKERDDLSLLKGLSGKDIDMLNKRGIFTVTQYSYTFRPRRPQKTASKQLGKHHHSLNALAIRTQTIYIARKPELPDATNRVYWDVEGIPDENFYYLIGYVIDDGVNVTSHSLWASDQTEEKEIWAIFLAKIAALDDFVLFHYGSYETKFLKQMGTKYGGNDELFAKIKSSSFNVLSAIYGQLYFPTYSNDLKSIASFWGFKWSEPNASGLTSVLWRKQWEKAHDETQKQKIIEYNNDDCLALRVVDACLRRISGNDSAEQKTYPAKHTDELKAQKPLGIFKRNQFYYPELEQINKRAYFDYQRSKVFLRTSPEVKKSITTKIKRIKQLGYKINSEISFDVPKRCPLCNTLSPIKHTKASRIVHDLKMFKYGIKRWVIKYKSPRCLCKKCNRTFFPPTYEKISSSKYGRNLFAWVIYKNIGRLVSQNAIVEDLGETFGYRFSGSMVEEMKIKAAREYQKTTDKLLLKIMTGNLIHIDETKISAKGANNYVWAITNMEDIVYLYNATRESDMIKEKLRDFKGVLVSDFYTAYDSISCPQQKCLIHLIRDMNEDIVTSSPD